MINGMAEITHTVQWLWVVRGGFLRGPVRLFSDLMSHDDLRDCERQNHLGKGSE